MIFLPGNIKPKVAHKLFSVISVRPESFRKKRIPDALRLRNDIRQEFTADAFPFTSNMMCKSLNFNDLLCFPVQFIATVRFTQRKVYQLNLCRKSLVYAERVG